MSIKEIFESQFVEAKRLRTAPVKDRVARLKKMRRWIESNRAAIKAAIYQDLAKSPEEADLTEVLVVLTDLRKAIRNVRYWSMPEMAKRNTAYLGTSGRIHYEPKGRVLIISPWNYPFSLAMLPMIAALAAGNTVIMKPSELAPHTSSIIEQLVREVFSPEQVHVVLGGVEVAQELLGLRFDHIFFTGSPRVGKIVMQAAAKNLTSITLELGGKSPCIVDRSADLKKAAKRIAWGKWLNAGQTCVAPDHLWVHAAVQQDFIGHLADYSRMYGDHDYSRIINKGHFDRLEQWGAEAVSKGAKVEFGHQYQRDKLYIAPTLLTNVDTDTALDQEEVFGPLLYLKTYESLSDVMDTISREEKPLAIYLFAQDRKVIKEVTKSVSAGSMAINDCVIQFSDPGMPFGGVNNSGIGKAHGRYGFLAFSNEKSVLKQRTGWSMIEVLYPPYNGFKRRILDFLIKYL